MKINLKLLVISTLTLALTQSCGDKNITNESIIEKAELDFQNDTTGCDCSDLSFLKDALGEPIEKEQHIFYLNDKKYTGSCYVKQFDDKSNKEFREYRNGLLDGKYFKWHENKKLASSLTFIKGLEHGEYKEFDENGNQITHINFSKGMPIGFNYFKEIKDGEDIGWHFFSNISQEETFDELLYYNQYSNYLDSDSKHKLNINDAFNLKPDLFTSLNRKMGEKDKYSLHLVDRKMDLISEKNMKAFLDSTDLILKANNLSVFVDEIWLGINKLNNSVAVDHYAVDKVRMVSPKHLAFFKLLTNSKKIKLDTEVLGYIETAKKGEKKSTSTGSYSDDESSWSFENENN